MHFHIWKSTRQLRSYCGELGNAAGKWIYLVTKGLETGANLPVQLRIPRIMWKCLHSWHSWHCQLWQSDLAEFINWELAQWKLSVLLVASPLQWLPAQLWVVRSHFNFAIKYPNMLSKSWNLAIKSQFIYTLFFFVLKSKCQQNRFLNLLSCVAGRIQKESGPLGA